MLSIVNAKSKINLNAYNNKISLYKSSNEVGQVRHYPPANKEWLNSIYAYNKDTSKTLSVADKVIGKIIKSYFNLYSRKLEKKIRSRPLRMRFRRLSLKRILVSSRAELKHTNDKVIITVYVYNRQKNYYLKKMLKARIKAGVKFSKFFSKKIRLIKVQALNILSTVRKEKNLLFKVLKGNRDNNLKTYEINYYKNFIIKSLDKVKLYLYFKQAMLLNKSKFEDFHLIPLTNLICKIYKKNVSFNLVSLKYLHLNSDIFTETMALKLRNRKNKLLKVLSASLFKIKIPVLKKLAVLDQLTNKPRKSQTLKVDSFLPNLNLIVKGIVGDTNVTLNTKVLDKDALQQILQKCHKKNLYDEKSKKIANSILNSIKNKSLNGIRVEASGRLSRRMIAARSVFKLRYIGNIQNLDSSYKGFSSVILRGHVKSNLQYTMVKSKTRIGSFGLKGWISSN